MLTRIYKNNNFTIKREEGDEAAANAQELVWLIANYADDLTVDYFEPCYYGNSYAVIECEIWCNGAPRYYHVRPEFVEQYNAGRVVRVEFRENVPLFVMPEFYGSYACELKNVKGRLYKLTAAPADDVREHMEAAGCTFLTTSPQYAPEIKHPAVFVPNGVYFSFC